MSESVLWTVITVTYNSSQAISEFAPKQIPDDVEWIVVDNASADESILVAQGLGASVVSLSKNVGFARANNIGLRRARGRYVAFLNPDVAWVPSDLDHLRLSLSSVGRDAIVSPQLLESDGSPQPNGRGVPTLLRKVANRAISKTEGYRIFAEQGQRKYVAWSMGAAVVAKRSTFTSLGGWNEAFFVYYEDHELGLRSWRNEVPVVLDGDVRWVHGWARETTNFRLRPWLFEIHGALNFFGRYPELLVTSRMIGRRMRGLRQSVGVVLPAGGDD